MGSMLDHPFGPPVASVPLNPHSLVFVVAQVRFPLVVSINDENFIGTFQELIRVQYPDLERAIEAQVMLGPEGVHRSAGGVVWKFSSPNNDWHVALTTSFVALSTTAYTSRGEFLERFGFVLQALEEWLKPRKVTRLGIRYVDRLQGDDVEHLDSYIRPEVLGPATVVPGDLGVLQHALTECHYELTGTGSLKARWGKLPAGTSLDPSVAAATGTSWVCDLDASIDNIDFDLADLMARAATFGDIIYRYYRWAVTDEFIREHGGVLT
jgi:uncharacterized protein (TIGR04255 family)